MHVGPVLHEEVFILPVVARNHMSAGCAPASTLPRKTRVGLHQTVVIRQLISLPDIADRNEVSVLIETDISLAAVIQIPLDGEFVEIKINVWLQIITVFDPGLSLLLDSRFRGNDVVVSGM